MDITPRYLHMDKQEVEKPTLWKDISIIKMKKEFMFRKLTKILKILVLFKEASK